MKWLVIVPALMLSFCTVPAWAEKPTSTQPKIAATVSAGEIKATPEMWFYEQQMQRYQDPKTMVRANAEVRAQQRQHRIESMKWFGFSNSRPVVNGDPWHGDYGPHWTSNSNFYPSRWSGMSQTVPSY
jgi:hypothetical protein